MSPAHIACCVKYRRRRLFSETDVVISIALVSFERPPLFTLSRQRPKAQGNMIHDFLRNVRKKNELIGIRTDREEWDQSLIGFITDLDDDSVTINELDRDGTLTGSTTILLTNILSIDFDDRYQQRLKFIHDNRSLLDANKQVTIWRTGTDLSDHLSFLIQNKNIATLYFSDPNDEDDNYVLGIVEAFDQNYIVIRNVGKEGDDDGQSCRLMNDLVGIKYAGVDEQKIALMYKNRNLFYKK